MSKVRIFAALVGSTLACRTAPPCAPVQADAIPLKLIAAPDANGRSSADASPTELRWYLLRGRAGVEAVTYEALLRRPAAEALGEAPLGEAKGVLYPKETRAVELPAAAEGRFVAVVAFVREPSGAAWRAVAPLPTPAKDVCATAAHGFTARLKGMRVELVARRGSTKPASAEPRPRWKERMPKEDPLRALDAPEPPPGASPQPRRLEKPGVQIEASPARQMPAPPARTPR